MKGPTKYDRMISILTGPNPPKSQDELLARTRFRHSTVKEYISQALRKGDLKPEHVPWRGTRAHTYVGDTLRRTNYALVTTYKQELEALREENTKLRVAANQAPRETSDPQLPYLIRILQAAGEELVDRAREAAFAPHAILTAQEEANEAAAGEVMAGSPAS